MALPYCTLCHNLSTSIDQSMAVFVPVLAGGAAAGAIAYQKFNPPQKQHESLNRPRDYQQGDWRLGPQVPKTRLADYWRNHVSRPSQPIEEAYRSTYNNMYTNMPKLVQDSVTGQPRWIGPFDSITQNVIIDQPGFGQERKRVAAAPPAANRTARNKRPMTMPTTA